MDRALYQPLSYFEPARHSTLVIIKYELLRSSILVRRLLNSAHSRRRIGVCMILPRLTMPSIDDRIDLKGVFIEINSCSIVPRYP